MKIAQHTNEQKYKAFVLIDRTYRLLTEGNGFYQLIVIMAMKQAQILSLMLITDLYLLHFYK